jgi:hypothetical protein
MDNRLEGRDSLLWIPEGPAVKNQSVGTGYTEFLVLDGTAYGPVRRWWRIDLVTIDIFFALADISASGSVYINPLGVGGFTVPFLSVCASVGTSGSILRATAQTTSPFYLNNYTEFGIQGSSTALATSIITACVFFSYANELPQ